MDIFINDFRDEGLPVNSFRQISMHRKQISVGLKFSCPKTSRQVTGVAGANHVRRFATCHREVRIRWMEKERS